MVEIWALILSGLTLLVVLIQEVRSHRTKPRVEWQIRTRGFPLHTNTAFLKNIGDADAGEVMILPNGIEYPEIHPGWLLEGIASGEMKKFEVGEVDDDAWVNVLWKSTHTGRRANVTWIPLFLESGLSQKRFDQQLWPWYRHLWMRMKGVKGTAPNALLNYSLPGSLRAQKKFSDRLNRRIERIETRPDRASFTAKLGLRWGRFTHALRESKHRLRSWLN